MSKTFAEDFEILKECIERCEANNYYVSICGPNPRNPTSDFQGWLQAYLIHEPRWAPHEAALRMWHAAKYGEPDGP
jgi:hypothetical protein